MKKIIVLISWLTGGLFIFSGLVKALDPRGLAYKMQEFFEAWAHDGFLPSLMNGLHNYALLFSVLMITLEVAVGVAIIIGWQKKWTTWILLLLIVFFTFLTSYVLFSEKIRACGCFGDCIPLTPQQTFGKDILLLLFALLLLLFRRHKLPLLKPLPAGLLVLVATLATLFLQMYVLKHLPFVDCLPYKKGNDILKLREMPADAVQDKFDYVFVYSKDGQQADFKVSALPDSTWKFVERKQILIEKGRNNVPLINDFSLSTASGNDSTEAILSQEGEYYLLMARELESFPENWNEDIGLVEKILSSGGRLYIVTAQRNALENRYKKDNGKGYSPIVFTCDGIAIKTAARANPVLFKMKGPVIQQKWSWADFDKVVQ